MTFFWMVWVKVADAVRIVPCWVTGHDIEYGEMEDVHGYNAVYMTDGFCTRCWRTHADWNLDPPGTPVYLQILKGNYRR